MKERVAPGMNPSIRPTVAAIAFAALLQSGAATAQAPIPAALTTPDRVESRIGTLEFKDGMPSAATLEKVYDNLDRSHAFRAFVDTFQGASTIAIRKGFLDIGGKDNEVLIFSSLMDAKSLFLTANADTVYFLGIIDLSKGPMVLEAPPGALGRGLHLTWLRVWLGNIAVVRHPFQLKERQGPS